MIRLRSALNYYKLLYKFGGNLNKQLNALSRDPVIGSQDNSFNCLFKFPPNLYSNLLSILGGSRLNIIKISHDDRIHNPPGGGSSVFKKEYVNYISNYLPKSDVRIIIGALPNSSPHFGTIITFSLAFSLAQRLKKLGKNVTV